MTHPSIPHVKGQKERKTSQLVILAITLFFAVPALSQAQVYDPTGIKRCFLDRYLDCAEAPGDAARLECYDALLVDIPAWLKVLPQRSMNDTSPLPRSLRSVTKQQCIPEEQE